MYLKKNDKNRLWAEKESRVKWVSSSSYQKEITRIPWALGYELNMG